MAAVGIVIFIVAAWLFLRTTRGTPRLANVLLHGRAAAVKAG